MRQGTGIITIATGKKVYADMAVQLAVSASFSGVPVSVITNMDYNFSGFDKVIRTEETNHYYLKTLINTLTPYETTLYIDADSLIDPELNLADELEKCEWFPLCAYEFAKLSPGKAENRKFRWANIESLFKECELVNPMSAFQSSIMAFTQDADPLFSEANKVYGQTTAVLTRDRRYPDELAFAIASSRTEIYPVKIFPVAFLSSVRDYRETKGSFILTKAGALNQQALKAWNNTLQKIA